MTLQLPDGTKLTSYASLNGTVNITPITSLVVGLSKSKALPTDTAKQQVLSKIRTDYGIYLFGDPITSPFIANGIGDDFEIERLSAKLQQSFSTTGQGSTLGAAIDGYATSMAVNQPPPDKASSESAWITDWLSTAAARTLYALSNTLPDSYVVDTTIYRDQPDFVRIVGGGAANAWNYLLAVPAESIPVATKSFVDTMVKVGQRDPLTGKVTWEFGSFGDISWEFVRMSATTLGTVASPGKAVSALCATSNDLSNGSDGIAYAESKQYCDALGGFSDIFFSGKAFLDNASDVGLAASKFKTSWLQQWKNNSYLMKVARKRSLSKMFKGSYEYARSIADISNTFAVNNIRAISTEYQSLLTEIGFLASEIDGMFPVPACPSGSTETTTGRCEPIANSDPTLVAWWNFNDCTADDQSGNMNNGAIVGSVACESGISGKALRFGGGKVEVPASASLHISGQLTIAALVKLDPGNSDAAGIVQKGRTNVNWDFGMTVYAHAPSYRSSATDWIPDPSSIPSQSSESYHLFVTVVDVGDTSAPIKLYIDGNSIPGPIRSIGGLDPILFRSALVSPSSLPLQIGIGHPGFPLKGSVDDLRIYSRALGQTEIQSLAVVLGVR